MGLMLFALALAIVNLLNTIAVPLIVLCALAMPLVVALELRDRFAAGHTRDARAGMHAPARRPARAHTLHHRRHVRHRWV